MAKIAQYQTIECGSGDSLDAAVNDEISEGWQPFGGVSVSHFEYEADGYTNVAKLFAQAMVKYAAEPNFNHTLPNPFVGPGPYPVKPDFTPTCDMTDKITKAMESINE